MIAGRASRIGLILGPLITACAVSFGCVPVPPERQPILVPVTSVAPPGPPVHTGDIPEVFPDLATLAAAADAVIRGRAIAPDQFQITSHVINRLHVAIPEIQLRLMDPQPGGPPLYGDPPLVMGQEYLLFLRTVDGANSRRFVAGDRTFKPVGGPQGQWRIQDGKVSQPADVPLKGRNGETVDAFVGGIAASDLRGNAVALLRQYGWSPGYASWVRQQQVGRLPGPTLEASRAIGLDPDSLADKYVLWMSYPVDGGPVNAPLEATVLMLDGDIVGAWVNKGGHHAFSLDQQEEAWAATTAFAIR